MSVDQAFVVIAVGNSLTGMAMIALHYQTRRHMDQWVDLIRSYGGFVRTQTLKTAQDVVNLKKELAACQMKS